MKFSSLLTALAVTCALALPASNSSSALLPSTSTSTSLAGYLGVFFLGDEPSIYFYLSNGNNAVSFKPLNAGKSILDPGLGTGGVRDPSIIGGAGEEAGKKWYIIGTDLDIAKTTWNQSIRNGSVGIFIWESTDLVNWGTERLVEVEGDSAGMAWAPDAIWDDDKGKYLVYWASRLYTDSDPGHNGETRPAVIRYAYTSDFKTFTAPETLIDLVTTSIIDLAIVELGPGSYARFIKNETDQTVWAERSDTGLFGSWTSPGGANAIVRKDVEGPYAYKDNLEKEKVHLILDYYGEDGYRPFASTNVDANEWVAEDRTEFPPLLRHGSVIGITQEHHDALNQKWG